MGTELLTGTAQLWRMEGAGEVSKCCLPLGEVQDCLRAAPRSDKVPVSHLAKQALCCKNVVYRGGCRGEVFTEFTAENEDNVVENAQGFLFL